MPERKDIEQTAVQIGVYVCHCGTNIAGMVDVKALTDYAATLPDVTIARNYKYLCSTPGQELIKRDIRELGLNRIVVAACSPCLHEKTFRNVTAEGGLNPYYFQMVNIREHDSWVHSDKQGSHRQGKGSDPRRRAARPSAQTAGAQARLHHPDVLIVGGGIAGIHAALTLANAGKHVYLVERDATIGGHMAMFDKTFPTLDCAACILTPKMTAVKVASQHHPVDLVRGHAGGRLRRQLPGDDQAQTTLRD